MLTSATRIRLSAMMFLQFFVWGTWYATMGVYLAKIGFSGSSNGAAYSTINIGAIVSPLLVGMIADRFFSAQRVMGIMHLTGAIVLWYLSTITEPGPFFWVLLIYSLLFMPTLALANAICFHQMDDPSREFPVIRVLGTIGWIAAGWVISIANIEDTAMIFQLGSIVSIIIGIYSFSLPDTPPKSKGRRASISSLLGLEAVSLLRDRNFAVFSLCSVLISIPLSFYFAFTAPFLSDAGIDNVGAKMTLGQVSEMVFLLLIPFFFRRMGVKWMLLTGMLSWAVRYVLFSIGVDQEMIWMLYVGVILHGICYDFFFVTGQIYVDDAAPKEIQASAQGFITLLTYGVGMLIGSRASGWIVDANTADGVKDWEAIWYVPALMAIGAAVAFGFLFSRKTS
ncbi:MAG: nucleoside permease [Bacteroidota bacterium]